MSKGNSTDRNSKKSKKLWNLGRQDSNYSSNDSHVSL